jgi:hypothetical protein
MTESRTPLTKRRMMSDDEMQRLVERALEHYEPRLEKLIVKVLDQRQELIGLPNHSEEQRAENKADALFLRTWRLRTDKTANRIGNAVLTAFAAGALAIVGVGARKLGWW